MRLLIGCSGVFALVAFIIGFAVSLFVRDASWTDRLSIATMTAAMTFVAVLFLANRDSANHSAAMRAVRSHLLAGSDTTDDDFVSSCPCDDPALLLETRRAISRFFDVPTAKVSRDVQLIDDLHVDKLDPSFQFHVVNSVIASQRIEPKPFGFSMAGLDTIDDFADAIRAVIDGFDRDTGNQSDSKV